jgi:hypothetical protein
MGLLGPGLFSSLVMSLPFMSECWTKGKEERDRKL